MRRNVVKIIVIFSIFFAGLLLCCNESNAATYSGKNYEIKISEYDYEVEAFEQDLTAISHNDRNYISLSVKHEDSGIVLDESYLNYLINTFQNKYGSTFTLISSKTLEVNGCKGVQMVFRDVVTYRYIYTDSYQFVSDNNQYVLLFTSLDYSYLSSQEKNQIFNSFKIKDTVKNSNGVPFTDVSRKSWYYGAVKFVSDSNIIKGTNEYTFAPDQKLTRGMLVTILHRMEGSPNVSGNSKFPDVQNPNMYYYTAIRWATQNNIVSGYNNGKFGAEDAITREQLAVILSNYSKFKGEYLEQANKLNKFSDAGKISSYARAGMQWATGAGVVSGSQGRLNPQGTTTRAEAASMLYKYYLNVR